MTPQEEIQALIDARISRRTNYPAALCYLADGSIELDYKAACQKIELALSVLVEFSNKDQWHNVKTTLTPIFWRQISLQLAEHGIPTLEGLSLEAYFEGKIELTIPYLQINKPNGDIIRIKIKNFVKGTDYPLIEMVAGFYGGKLERMIIGEIPKHTDSV